MRRRVETAFFRFKAPRANAARRVAFSQLSMIVCPILSGSSGNATYVESGSTRLLVDAGGAGRCIETNLRKIGVDPSSLTCLLATHEHDDHIRGLGVLSRRYNLPIYASVGVWDFLIRSARIGEISKRFIKPFLSVKSDVLDLGDIKATYFATAHDECDSVGYVFDDGKSKFGLATDLGHVTPRVRGSLLGCDAVLLESNYDYQSLIKGPYPYPLKQRILSPTGHLDNEDAGKFVAELVRSGVKYIFLGHLSENNNTERLAYDTVSRVLRESGIEPQTTCKIYMTKRYEPSRKLEF